MPTPRRSGLVFCTLLLTAAVLWNQPAVRQQQRQVPGLKDAVEVIRDRWGVPHNNGSIESDDYKVPSADAVRSAVRDSNFDPREVALYLASAGLLIGGEWADATWPVADEVLSTRLPSAP